MTRPSLSGMAASMGNPKWVSEIVVMGVERHGKRCFGQGRLAIKIRVQRYDHSQLDELRFALIY